jgi:hypothetical protein
MKGEIREIETGLKGKKQIATAQGNHLCLPCKTIGFCNDCKIRFFSYVFS